MIESPSLSCGIMNSSGFHSKLRPRSSEHSPSRRNHLANSQSGSGRVAGGCGSAHTPTCLLCTPQPRPGQRRLVSSYASGARPAGRSTGDRLPCQARLQLLLARAAAQAHVSDAHLMRTVTRAAPPAVVRLARILRRRLLRGAREPRIGGSRLSRPYKTN